MANDNSLYVKIGNQQSGSSALEVRVTNGSSPAPTPVDTGWQTVAHNGEPFVFDRNDLAPGHYTVSIKWDEGYHNVAHGVDGNTITINGNNILFQVLGTADDSSHFIQGMFDAYIQG
ncbi:MAG TPA: hypothetical protein DDW81_01450 [Cryomorphaceae bacterium]|nr:hypothetical protein [Owenweeksia sp.]HBF18728.1 hypothetical protein [Cryomorphaceae bacterium]|tara:strand:- start:147 stop:497 length:351 start_codon:yes stop_codon:yes gene_type:complete